MRQLVTIRTVKSIEEIPGSDFLALAKVDGWQCVVKKDSLRVHDPALYFEIDSILPADDERWAFLEPRKYRIKTMKLRKTLSQGLLMPMSTLTDEEVQRWRQATESQDAETLTDILRVQKYEPPVPMSGEQKGNFPTHLVPKSDQERIQNIPSILGGRQSYEFEITEKLDGTSCTFFYVKAIDPYFATLYGAEGNEPKFGACSRNWEIDLEDNNVYAKLFRELNLEAQLAALGRNLAIQGEIIGPKIQGNKYKRGAQEFRVFDIYDIDKRRYLWPVERIKLADQLGLLHVPILHFYHTFEPIMEGPHQQVTDPSVALTLELVLAAADGKSQLHDTKREGLVFKHHGRHDGSQEPLSFKVISNKFLLKNE